MNLNQITLIKNCDSLKKEMEKLDSNFQQRSEVNKLIVHKRFHQFKMNPNDQSRLKKLEKI